MSTFQDAQAALGSYREQYNALANVLKDISAYERQAQAVKNTEDKLDLLKSQLANIKEEYDRTGQSSSDLKNKMEAKQHQIDKTTEALENQKGKLGDLEEKLNGAGVTTDNMKEKTAELTKEMDNLRKKEDDTGEETSEFARKMSDAADTLSDMENILAAAGLIKLVDALSDSMRDCASAALEFEYGMAGVRRTVGGTEEEIDALGDSFIEMASVMPITTSELTQIATTAGQLGIAQDNVEDFTRVMAELATTTDLSADRAATLLAQFSNITGTTDYDRLGSTIAALGDSTATTASRIVEMSQGMAAAADIAGMSAQDVLGIAAAVGALGGRTQTGATAMSQLITKIQLAVETGEGLEGYANTAGLTALEFKRAWGEDAAGALNKFVQGLNDTERNGKTALAVLSDLGISNARQLRVFTGLANSGDLLSRSLDLANQSWNENTALTEKAGIMYDTTKAKMTTMQNQVNNLKIAIGDQLNPALGNIYEAIGRFVGGLTDFLKEHPGVVRAVTAIAVALSTLAATLALVKGAVVALNLIAAASFGPGGWMLLGLEAVVALSGTMAALTAATDESTASLREMNDAVKGVDDAFKDSNMQLETAEEDTNAAVFAVGNYIARLEELEEAGLNSTSAQKEYSTILNEINRLMPGLNAQIDEQTGLVEGGASSLYKLADGWKEAAMMQAYYQAASEKMEAWSKLQQQVEQDEARLVIVNKELEGVYARREEKVKALEEAERRRDEFLKTTDLKGKARSEELRKYDKDVSNAQRNVDTFYHHLSKGEREAMAEQKSLTAAIEQGKAKMEEYEGEINTLSEKYGVYADAAEEGADATESELGPMEAVTDQLDLLAAAYDEAYDAALKSVEGQFDLWDEAPEVVATGAETIRTNLDSQIGYWTDYSTNLDNLMGRNIEGMGNMLASFADGSKESAEMIAGLASLGDEELQGIVGKYNDLQAAQGDTADAIRTAGIDIDAAMQNVVGVVKQGVSDMNVSTEARNSAMATLNAYISAAEQQKSRVSAAYAAVAQAAKNALQYSSMTVTARTGDIGRVGYGGAASGIDSAPEGWRWVGEYGPELMYFQGGETVIPHTKSVEMLKSGGDQQIINVTLAPSYQISGTNNATDVKAILEEHDRQLPAKVTAILREASRDAVRRSYA